MNTASRSPARPLARLVLPLLGPLLSAGCARQEAPPAGGQAEAKGPPAVQTARPVRKTLTYKVEQPGEVQAFEQTPMYARISGYVRDVYKDIGDKVKKGEVLAELSVPERDEELKQKQALKAQAGAEVEQAKKLLASSEADLKSAQAKVKEVASSRVRADAELRRAQSQYKRLKKTPGVISEEILAETELGVESAAALVAEVEAKVGSAEAAVVSAKAKRDKARADISLAEAKLQVATADERGTAALLGYAKLRAPFAGVVTRRNVDPGHLLQASAGGPKGEAVFVVAKTDPVRVFVDVPENDAVLVTDGSRAVVSVQALQGEEFKGTVKRSAWALDPKGRILRTEIDLRNPDGRLRPGMYAYAVIAVERKDVLAVPAAALVAKGDQHFCYLVEGGKAVQTPVKIGIRDGQFVEVLKKRLPGREGRWQDFSGEEQVIVGSPANLADGQAVAVSRNP